LAKCEQAAAAKKSVGHFATRFRQTMRFSREESFQDLVSRQKALLNLCGELALGGHLFLRAAALTAHSANSWQGIADEHVDDSAAAI
jgi:hypothetical protein